MEQIKQMNQIPLIPGVFVETNDSCYYEIYISYAAPHDRGFTHVFQTKEEADKCFEYVKSLYDRHVIEDWPKKFKARDHRKGFECDVTIYIYESQFMKYDRFICMV